MSYFVANKLTVPLTTIVLALFTTICGILDARLILPRDDFQSLYLYILRQKGAGNIDLPWFGTNPEWAVQILTYLFYAVTVGGYVGCLAFFFYQRSEHRPDLPA